MFSGFPTETIDFLADLRANNSKEWFDGNRKRYDEHYIGAAKEFVVAAGEALTELVPDIVAEPKVNGSIFKINRDVRFSKDKTPTRSTSTSASGRAIGRRHRQRSCSGSPSMTTALQPGRLASTRLGSNGSAEPSGASGRRSRAPSTRSRQPATTSTVKR